MDWIVLHPEFWTDIQPGHHANCPILPFYKNDRGTIQALTRANHFLNCKSNPSVWNIHWQGIPASVTDCIMRESSNSLGWKWTSHNNSSTSCPVSVSLSPSLREGPKFSCSNSFLFIPKGGYLPLLDATGSVRAQSIHFNDCLNISFPMNHSGTCILDQGLMVPFHPKGLPGTNLYDPMGDFTSHGLSQILTTMCVAWLPNSVCLAEPTQYAIHLHFQA